MSLYISNLKRSARYQKQILHGASFLLLSFITTCITTIVVFVRIALVQEAFYHLGISYAAKPAQLFVP